MSQARAIADRVVRRAVAALNDASGASLTEDQIEKIVAVAAEELAPIFDEPPAGDDTPLDLGSESEAEPSGDATGTT